MSEQGHKKNTNGSLATLPNEVGRVTSDQKVGRVTSDHLTFCKTVVLFLVLVLQNSCAISGARFAKQLCYFWCSFCKTVVLFLVLVLQNSCAISGARLAKQLCYFWCSFCKTVVLFLVLVLQNSCAISGARFAKQLCSFWRSIFWGQFFPKVDCSLWCFVWCSRLCFLCIGIKLWASEAKKRILKKHEREHQKKHDKLQLTLKEKKLVPTGFCFSSLLLRFAPFFFSNFPCRRTAAFFFWSV